MRGLPVDRARVRAVRRRRRRAAGLPDLLDLARPRRHGVRCQRARRRRHATVGVDRRRAGDRLQLLTQRRRRSAAACAAQGAQHRRSRQQRAQQPELLEQLGSSQAGRRWSARSGGGGGHRRRRWTPRVLKLVRARRPEIRPAKQAARRAFDEGWRWPSRPRRPGCPHRVRTGRHRAGGRVGASVRLDLDATQASKIRNPRHDGAPSGPFGGVTVDTRSRILHGRTSPAAIRSVLRAWARIAVCSRTFAVRHHRHRAERSRTGVSREVPR